MKDKFYVTTSIVYTNASPHIGFALELIQADVIARYHRLKGKDTYFLTGTDEHGQKIAKKAKEQGIAIQEFVDKTAAKFYKLTEKLDISNDDFIRTTDKKRHWPTAEALWKKLQANKDLYKQKYTGYYCVGCEAFLTEKEIVNGRCPVHHVEPEKVEEENYFFKLSKYQDKIKTLIQEDKLKIIPEARKKEILSFIEGGLSDISVSRSAAKLQWGIPVPGDPSQVMYVWVDALSNYLSALDYAHDGKKYKKYWPADVHCIGKDIVRFHSIIWIGILLAVGLEIPKRIFVHGFITSAGEKMSKSLGNIVDPLKLADRFGTDPLRYYLLAEISSTGDGDFTETKLINRHNTDLADGLGNLLSRTIGLAKKNSVKLDLQRNPGGEIKQQIAKIEKEVEKNIELLELKKAIEKIWDLIHYADRYIEKKKPWQESWEQEKVIFEMLYICYTLSELLLPFLPETALKMKEQLLTGEKEILFSKK